jgi:hypothetical protein
MPALPDLCPLAARANYLISRRKSRDVHWRDGLWAVPPTEKMIRVR